MRNEKVGIIIFLISYFLLVARVAACGTFILPVAGQAIAHVQRAELIHALHFFHRPVALGAVKAFGNMYLMRKVRVLRQFVDPRPFDGFALRVGFHKLDDVRFVHRHHAVAVHADIQCGNGGML